MKKNATLRSKAYLEKHEDRGSGVSLEMLRLAGRRVTITSFASSHHEGAYYKIKEDCGEWMWDRWMFKHVDERFVAKRVKLPVPIDYNKFVVVMPNGDVEIGCQTISKKVIDFVYKASLRARKK